MNMRMIISMKMIMINDWLRHNNMKPSIDLILYSKLKAHTFIITYRLLINYFDEDYL
jgi:hypothetical protein